MKPQPEWRVITSEMILLAMSVASSAQKPENIRLSHFSGDASA
jgi:hypothetical protein